jgi:hypothetical protein
MTEFTHYIPTRVEGMPRSIYNLEWDAWIDHAHWVLDNSDLFSPAMVRYEREQLEVMDEYRHGKHFRVRP